MNRRHRHRLSRGPSRDARAFEPILVVCEGKKTEPIYFKGLLRLLPRIVSTAVRLVPAAAAPITVVRKAKEVNETDGPFDRVWCLFDVEECGKNSSLRRALSMAKDNEFSVGISNPCFEYWLLLHFEKCGKAFTCCKPVVDRLRGHLPKYEKGAEVNEELLNRRQTACKNAAAILRDQWQHETDHTKCNPCTRLHELVELLDEMAKRRPY